MSLIALERMIPPSAPGPDRGALSSPCGGGPRRLASQIAPWLFVAGLLLQLPTLTWIGIILFGSSSLFAFLTLPVEFNASARAQKAPMFPRNTVARQAKYRERLPQLGGGVFLTDGGLEMRRRRQWRGRAVREMVPSTHSPVWRTLSPVPISST